VIGDFCAAGFGGTVRDTSRISIGAAECVDKQVSLTMQRKTVTGLAMRLGVCLTLSAVNTALVRASDPVVTPPAAAPGARSSAAGARAGGAVGVRSTSIVGVAWNADNTPIPAARVRLRNVVTGKIASAAITDAAGQFTFESTEPGAYLIELVTETGKIVAVGHTFSVAPGETVATFVRASTKVPWFTGFFGNAASAIAATAASAGVTAIAPDAKPCSSPSPGCI
jgi:Carboxypeptidase regulatory-like domain